MAEYHVHFTKNESGQLEVIIPVDFRTLNYGEKVYEIVDLAWNAGREDGLFTSDNINDYTFDVITKSKSI